MLSRVAEATYWMSRQVERAENMGRFIEIAAGLSLEHPDIFVDPWYPLVQATGDDKHFTENYPDKRPSDVVRMLAFDRGYQSSILTCLSAARENIRGIRETVSSELFEHLNALYHHIVDAERHFADGWQPDSQWFADLRNRMLMWAGIVDHTMPRDISWHFMNVGRMLERADKTTRILDVKYFTLLPKVTDAGSPVDDLQWSALLLSLSGAEAFRRRHHLTEVDKVVDFIVCDRTFNRSIAFCLARADASVAEIERLGGAVAEHRTPETIHDLRQRIEAVVPSSIVSTMHEFIDSVQTGLNVVGDHLRDDYFPRPQVVGDATGGAAA